MAEYRVPTGDGGAELVEKRSRFLGHVFVVTCEEDARARIDEMKKTYHDARHNCWCYRLHQGGLERYSDDGEPQGTAGQPMLNVFQREGVENVCCVVTRYFGGVLLGAGGLVRAYTQSAKDALDAAGISQVSRWVRMELNCPYPLLERLKLEVESLGGLLEGADYAADVTLTALFPGDKVESFTAHVTELTAGGVLPAITGEVYRARPLTAEK